MKNLEFQLLNVARRITKLGAATALGLFVYETMPIAFV